MPELKIDFKNLGSIRLMPLDASSLHLPFGRPIADYLRGVVGSQNGARILLRQAAIDFTPLIRWTESTAWSLRTTGFGELERDGIVEPTVPAKDADPAVADFLAMNAVGPAALDGKPSNISVPAESEGLAISKPRIDAFPLRPRMTFGPPPPSKVKPVPVPAPAPAPKPVAAPIAAKPAVTAPPPKPSPVAAPKMVTPVKVVGSPTPVQPKPVIVIPPAPRPAAAPAPVQRVAPPPPPAPATAAKVVEAPSAPVAPKPAAAPVSPKISMPAAPAARAPEPLPAPKPAPPPTPAPLQSQVPPQAKAAPVSAPPPAVPSVSTVAPAVSAPTTKPVVVSAPASSALTTTPVSAPTAKPVAVPPPAIPAPAPTPVAKPATPAPVIERTPAPSAGPAIESPLTLGIARPESFFERIPMALKIGVALLVLFVGIYFVFGRSSKGSGEAAAVAVGEQGWSTEQVSDPVGSRHGRQLTIYRPSVGMTDYQLQFAGQIETKAIGWFFREADTKNYYAMKIENLAPGKMAITHFAVIEGRESGYSQRPLGVDARPGATYKVNLEVSGPRFTVYVGGEPVDFWTDNRLKSGALGFMSERDERGATSSVRFSFPKGGK